MIRETRATIERALEILDRGPPLCPGSSTKTLLNPLV
jgi:hypothetical protein